MPAITRRGFLVGASATALTSRFAAASTPESATPIAATPVTSEGKGIACGIKYDLGAELARNELTRPATHEQFYRDELIAIRDQLHCQTVDLYGSGPEQLIAGLDTAADLQFDIHLQTRLNFLAEDEMNERLAAVAMEAERVRKAGIPIVLDVGCEYLLFADGMIEGNDFFEKMEVINSEDVDWNQILRRFDMLLGSLAETARTHFGGLVTYSDTPDFPVNWDHFDIIGIDHYLSSDSQDTYVETINGLAASGKPVWIKEFGSPPWQGASEAGGMAWDIVDYTLDPPVIVDGIVRDEDAQADAMIETLELISQSEAERAYLYEFITTGSTRSDDPQYDYDLTGYGIVSTWGPEHDQQYETTGYWEPKVAFDRLAEWNREHEIRARRSLHSGQ